MEVECVDFLHQHRRRHTVGCLHARLCHFLQLRHRRGAANSQHGCGDVLHDLAEDFPLLSETLLGKQCNPHRKLLRAVWKPKRPFHLRLFLCHVLVLALVYEPAQGQCQLQL